jgi:hypothetical protein
VGASQLAVKFHESLTASIRAASLPLPIPSSDIVMLTFSIDMVLGDKTANGRNNHELICITLLSQPSSFALIRG